MQVSAGDVNLKARLDVTGTTALKGATAITRTTAGPALTIDAAAGSAALQTADPVVVDAAVTANSLKVRGKGQGTRWARQGASRDPCIPSPTPPYPVHLRR